VEDQAMPDGRDVQEGPPRESSLVPVTVEEPLERRVHRLEEAVARLSGTNGPAALDRAGQPAIPPDSSNGPVERAPLPRATPIPPVPMASLADFTLPPVALPPPVPDSSFQAIMRPLQTGLPFSPQVFHRVLPPSALVRDLWWDLRTGWRMIRDPYYPMTLAGKVVPLFALFYVCVWPWFSSWTGLIGTVMSGLVYIVILYIAFKVIQRELRRYYEFSQRYRG
jgi:hypothetical protein